MLRTGFSETIVLLRSIHHLEKSRKTNLPNRKHRLLEMADQKATNITWHAHAVTKQQRLALSGHQGLVLWLTGLSSSGKSTVANELDAKLNARGVRSFLLDGDNVRHGLNKNLGFSAEDRAENIRRVSEVAKLFAEAGVITITAFISPYRKDREEARALLSAGEFIEIYVDCPLEVCEQRDPKGLYEKARKGEIKGFTGIDDPYDVPENPELTLDADGKTPDVLADEIIAHLEKSGAFQN